MFFEYALIFVMAICGLATHMLKDLVRIRQEEGKLMNLVSYWKEFPYQSALSVIGVIVGLVMMSSMGGLTPLTAFGAGYMCNSFSDIAGKRAISKIGG